MYFVWGSAALCRASEERTEVRIGFPVEHHLQQMTGHTAGNSLPPCSGMCRPAAINAAFQVPARN
jgi:hypothetical protein